MSETEGHESAEHSGGHKSHGAHGGGGHEEAHEGAPEWLISFADNVALMMGFFVVLLAMNMPKPNTGGIGGQDKEPGNGDSAAMQDFAIELRAAFGNAVDPNSKDPRDAALRKRLLQRQTAGPSASPGPDGHKHDVQPAAIKPTDWVAPFGVVQFDTGQGAVTPAGRTTIVQVSEQIRGRKAVIEVRGHVSAAEAPRDPAKARELAYKRAYAVAHVLAENGVRWEQMRVVSCGDSFPLRGRADTAEEHRQNQRVEIVMTQETMPADQFTTEAPADKQ